MPVIRTSDHPLDESTRPEWSQVTIAVILTPSAVVSASLNSWALLEVRNRKAGVAVGVDPGEAMRSLESEMFKTLSQEAKSSDPSPATPRSPLLRRS